MTKSVFAFIKKYLLLTILLSSIAVFTINLVQNKYFDVDEFENAHVAWSLKEGQLLYRDIIESHGPLYHLINASSWKLLSFQDQTATLFKLRYINVLFMFITFIIIYKITDYLHSPEAGFLAVFILSTVFIFIQKSIEIRPDTLQNLLWLMGIYVSIMLFKTKNTSRLKTMTFFMGLLWGSGILSNFKAIFQISVSFLMLIYFLASLNKKFLINYFLAGLLSPIVLTVIILFLNNCSYTFFYNVIFLKILTLIINNLRTNISYFLVLFLKTNLFLLFIYLLSIINFKHNKKEIQYLSGLGLVMFFSIFLFGFWPQWYLPFISLLTINSSIIIIKTINGEIFSYEKPLLILNIILIGFLALNIYNNYQQTRTYKTNKNQIISTNKLLAVSSRQDKVLWFRTEQNAICVFRAHLFPNFNIPFTIEPLFKYVPNLKEIKAANFFKYLKHNNCTIIDIPAEKFYILSLPTRQYIQTNYRKIGENFWLAKPLAAKYYKLRIINK